MKLVTKIATLLVLVAMAGCGEHGDTPAKTADPKPADLGILKTQRETLEQAKQVEQTLQDAAEQQRQKIAEQTQ